MKSIMMIKRLLKEDVRRPQDSPRLKVHDRISTNVEPCIHFPPNISIREVERIFVISVEPEKKAILPSYTNAVQVRVQVSVREKSRKKKEKKKDIQKQAETDR